MPVKPLLRLINLRRINLLLCALIVWIGVQWQSSLFWAAKVMPGYFQDSIASPIEITLYQEAEQLLRERNSADNVRQLLEHSLKIDPYTRARYLLGTYYRKKGQDAEALRHYLKYLSIDPTVADTYREIARIHTSRGETAAAEQILRQGLQYFAATCEHFKPQLNYWVEEPFNRKAVTVYQNCQKAQEELLRELDAIKL